ncbi:MAG: hypothetical protein Q9205_002766 [Flavoplaca limonia]
MDADLADQILQSFPADSSVLKLWTTLPEPRCYAPAVTFFDPEIDKLGLLSQKKYFTYLCSTGLKGLFILGTNAETFPLNREERKTLLKTARQAVPACYPIIAGVGGHSTSQVLEYISTPIPLEPTTCSSSYVLISENKPPLPS